MIKFDWLTLTIKVIARLKMSHNITGTNTMSKATPTPSVKRVSKKTDAAVAPVAAAASTAAAASSATSSAAEDKHAKKSKPSVAAAAPVAMAPVVSAVTEHEAAPVEVKSVEQEIAALIVSNQKIRDEAVANIKVLQRLHKRVAKEVKEAGKRRRRAKREGEDGVAKEKRPTIFTTPVTLKDELCSFLGKSKGSQMTPADVTRAFSAYVDSHKLKDAEKGHTIHPDVAMRKVLGVKEGENLTYRNIQSYLYKLYILPEKKKVAAA
jgi:chromatin remodeling complex protein RSC6